MLGLIIVLLIFLALDYHSNYNHPKWAALILMISAFIAIQIGQITNPFIGLTYFYLTCVPIYHSCYRFADAEGINYKMPISKEMGLDTSVIRNGMSIIACGLDLWLCRVALQLLAIGSLFVILNKVWLISILDTIPYLLIINLIYNLLPRKYRIVHCRDRKFSFPSKGFGCNDSVSSSLISIMFGVMLLHEYPYYLKEIATLATVMALFRNKATAGILGAGGASFFFLISQGQVYLAILLAVFGISILIIKRATLLNDSGRYIIWKVMKDKLGDINKLVFGYGNGTFPMRMLQSGTYSINGSKPQAFTRAHNDLLQFFFENGIAGTVLLVLGFIFLPHSWAMLILVATVLPNVLFNFSFRMAPDVFFMIIGFKFFFV